MCAFQEGHHSPSPSQPHPFSGTTCFTSILVLEEKFVTKEIEESHCVALGHRVGCQQSVTSQTIHNLDISLDFLSVPVQVALGKRDYIPPSIVQKAVSCGEKNLRMFYSPKYLLFT